jgi:hypothetical protein
VVFAFSVREMPDYRSVDNQLNEVLVRLREFNRKKFEEACMTAR